jgi:shikimate dehydrogenase
MGKQFGLIGYPLTHSFSKKFFEKKFLEYNLAGYTYDLFELKHINLFKELIDSRPELSGLNVTIPYKQAVIPYLDSLDPTAKLVGAVNVIFNKRGQLFGYNSDFYGFQESLLNWLPAGHDGFSALIFGNGGAAKAVKAVFTSIGIPYQTVSRSESSDSITYEELRESNLIEKNKLLINTTPVGMVPNIDQHINIPFSQIDKFHFLFDLIYNPNETQFLSKGKRRGAQIKNGLEMLELQAEKSWEIWTS